jgi:ATP-binding protein involved in chromosome partitioning
MDPRTSVISERLKDVDRIIVVCAGKGGVGKSTITSLLALSLAEEGKKVGLLDLDFHGPSTHVILGVGNVFPEEEKGIIPPTVHGIKYMSITYFTGDEPTPLRGRAVSNAVIELLAITQWGNLDYLIIDMPPGFGDPTLDTIRLVEKAEYLVVTTPSRVTQDVVKKLVKLLQDQNKNIMGVVVNMNRSDVSPVKLGGVRVLAELGYDPGLEGAVGDAEKLLDTTLAEKLRESGLNLL